MIIHRGNGFSGKLFFGYQRVASQETTSLNDHDSSTRTSISPYLPPVEDPQEDNIENFVKLFYYRKYEEKPKNAAYFVPNGMEIMQNYISEKFDRNLETKIIIHGWLNNKNSLQFQQFKEAYLSNEDRNIFIVDWSDISEDINYMRAANFTQIVGMYVANKIKQLVNETRANVSTFHLIGHSLGAHIAGFAGAQIKNPSISRITGLDPALPNFQRFRDPDMRLDPSDADFVDIIHTSGGTLGTYASIGTADFYVNGGTPPQPGCSGVSELAAICSHGRAVLYYLESITSSAKFYGVQCDSWSAYKNEDCKGGFVEMGEMTNPSTKGIFYLGTNFRPPYAMGKKVFYEKEPFWRTAINSIIHQSSSSFKSSKIRKFLFF
ncbi:hypothetical protein DMENIID0001_113120 [Sergentomyia squamirostris]